jgi:serine/threonine protein kinase
MTFNAGTRIGSYEILARIGAGGMGEVYRGRDRKLGRDVAVKVLPQAFAQDAERLARVEREAQVLASLNHPNIAVIHELEEANGSKYLILELVEGETLAEKIARGPVPLDDALDIARQIAEALEAAHEKGIVHRDLKPANVKITPEGRVKVLDFGLAKVFEASSAPQDLSNSPTLSAVQSERGVILGTAAYMSPEQARGKNVDQRGDVWAWGCILYEMLAGRQAFPNGETVSDTLAGILAREPDWQALPAGTPRPIRKLLERCLRKDPRHRLHNIADARIEIDEARSESVPSAAISAVPVRSRRCEIVLGALAVLFLLTTVGVILRFAVSPTATLDAPPVRFEVSAPNGGILGSHDLSPDGRKLAFVAFAGSKVLIWVRALDSSTAQPIPSTEGTGSQVFWSPDSQYIGFFADGKLKKVAASGGPASVICTLPPAPGRIVIGGAVVGPNYVGTWNAEGVILISVPAADMPLFRVPASGGQPSRLTALDASRNERQHRFPYFLPDGQHYLYMAAAGPDATTYVGTLGSTERHPLPGIASDVKYAPSGHLIFVREGALMAQRFDAKRLELSGEAFPIADPFTGSNARTGPFSVSTTGSLAYRVTPAAQESGNSQNNQLAWFDRKGQQIAPVGPTGEYRSPALSPDDKYVAVERGNPPDIWVLDVQKGVFNQFTSNPAADSFAVWSPDVKSIAFGSSREAGNIWVRPFGTVADERLVLKDGGNPTDWSRDGKYLTFDRVQHIWALPLSGDAKPLLITPDTILRAWCAYFTRRTLDRIFVYGVGDAGASTEFAEPGVHPVLSSARYEKAGIDGRWLCPAMEPRWQGTLLHWSGSHDDVRFRENLSIFTGSRPPCPSL